MQNFKPQITNLNSPIFKKLLSLELNPEDYLVFGSTPMWLYGLKNLSSDIDILARGEAWSKAITLGNVETPASGKSKVVRFFGSDIEIFDAWYPGEWDNDDLIDNAIIVEGIRFASLDNVLKWKKNLEGKRIWSMLELLKSTYLKLQKTSHLPDVRQEAQNSIQ